MLPHAPPGCQYDTWGRPGTPTELPPEHSSAPGAALSPYTFLILVKTLRISSSLSKLFARPILHVADALRALHVSTQFVPGADSRHPNVCAFTTETHSRILSDTIIDSIGLWGGRRPRGNRGEAHGPSELATRSATTERVPSNVRGAPSGTGRLGARSWRN